jgi:hypothetical protein
MNKYNLEIFEQDVIYWILYTTNMLRIASSSTTQRLGLIRSLGRALATDAAPLTDGLRSNIGGPLEEGPHMMNGLLQFDTLHEIQVRSAEQWADKPLFGTFSEVSHNNSPNPNPNLNPNHLPKH